MQFVTGCHHWIGSVRSLIVVVGVWILKVPLLVYGMVHCRMSNNSTFSLRSFVEYCADGQLTESVERVLFDRSIMGIVFGVLDRQSNYRNSLVCKMWAEWASHFVWGEVDVRVLRCVGRLWIWGGGVAVSDSFNFRDCCLVSDPSGFLWF